MNQVNEQPEMSKLSGCVLGPIKSLCILTPVFPIQRPVLNRFGHVIHLDDFASGQICDRAAHLQDPRKGAVPKLSSKTASSSRRKD